MNITSALNDTLYTPREDILFTDALMILSRGVASRSGRVKVLFFCCGWGWKPSIRPEANGGSSDRGRRRARNTAPRRQFESVPLARRIDWIERGLDEDGSSE